MRRPPARPVPGSYLSRPTTRRDALRTLGGLAGLAAVGPLALGCGDDGPTGAGPREPLVLFVPGFLSQLYTAFSEYGEDVLNAELRALALTVPVIGDRIAAALPRINLPIRSGGLITFASLQAVYDAAGIDYVDISRVGSSAFNSQKGVVDNGAAIAALLETYRDRDVTLVSHSKGGLDVLQALLENPGYVGSTVSKWVALQPPFHGSPVADNVPTAIAGRLLQAFGGDETALLDLKTAERGAYMTERENSIAALTAAIPVTVGYSSFTPDAGVTFQTVAVEFAQSVINANTLAQIAAIVAANLFDPAQAAAEAVALIRSRANALILGIMNDIPMMGLSSRTIPGADDGLVPVASAVLAGATMQQLTPATDHAGPVMDVTPFKNFWSDGYRNSVTGGLVGATAGTPA